MGMWMKMAVGMGQRTLVGREVRTLVGLWASVPIRCVYP